MNLIIEPEWNPETEQDCYAWSWIDPVEDIVLAGGYGATEQDAFNDAMIWRAGQNFTK